MSELDPQNALVEQPSELAQNGPQDEPGNDPQNQVAADGETVKTKDKKKKKKKDDKDRDPEKEKKKKDKKEKKLKIKGELFDDANIDDGASALKSVGQTQNMIDDEGNIDAVIKNTK